LRLFIHTELISGLLKEGKIKIARGGFGAITYHDSCYLEDTTIFISRPGKY